MPELSVPYGDYSERRGETANEKLMPELGVPHEDYPEKRT
jgi:hypothetical protein